MVSPGLASAMTVDKQLTINVFQVCDDFGGNCASTGPAGNAYYAAETNKIWEQAGISVVFSSTVTQINQSKYLNLYDTQDISQSHYTFGDLAAAYGTGGPVSSGPIDMFLINDYEGAYGVGWYGTGGLVMSMSTISSFDCSGAAGCTGRIDTLAHEIGHNFGLVAVGSPYSLTGDTAHSTDNNQLMGPGQTRNVPTTIADINPSGLGLDQLSADQIALARTSLLLTDVSPVPEPEGYAMMLAGLGVMGFVSRRKQRRAA
ncbi:PEP-CTERM sorting domain-containing protein [Sphaerotilus montanus]|uniref:PEP-CTERM sorting domain-containing protein n=1 Tax=Sphaerotilus montanus TaxID=522889 RepID=UPI003FA1BB99